jgi:phosphohistidine phosphatase
MELYLIQHGQAAAKEQDPNRPLTEAGWAAARRTAETAVKLGIDVSEIRHSNKLRALQTAEELAQSLETECRPSAGLSPEDDVQPVAKELDSRQDGLMIVGHLPFLGRLAALLLGGKAVENLVEFRMAGIVRLDRREDSTWSLVWAIPPEAM